MVPGMASYNGGSGKAESQLRKGVLEYCVLGLLRDGSRYGVELLEALSTVDVMATSQGTIYPLLARLRRDGLVDTTWQESPSGPPRRYYALTPPGEAALKEFTEIWPLFRDAVDRFITDQRRPPNVSPGGSP
ncbi:PadR family transcriptional regulator [Streptomyces sp. NPDC001414]